MLFIFLSLSLFNKICNRMRTFSYSALANPVGKKIQSVKALVRVEDLWRGESSTLHQKARRPGSRVWGVASIGSTIRNCSGGRFRTRLFPTKGNGSFFISKKKERGDCRCYITWNWWNSQGSNDINETLLKKINDGGNIHLVPSKINDMYFLRFAICSRFSESKDIQNSWKEIKLRTDEVFEEQSVSKWWRAQIARGCRSLAPATCNQS